MTIVPILSGATSLKQLKKLLPLAYQYRKSGNDEFFAEALTKAKTFDANFTLADLLAIPGINPSAGESQTNDAETSSPISWVNSINQKYAWIEADASIYRLDYGDFIRPADFKTQLDNQTVSIKSGDNQKSVGVGTAWLKNPGRRQHRQLVIRPNSGQVTADNCLNEWQGFAIQPAAGSVDPFLALLKRLVPDRNAQRYVLSWLAHLVKHPDIKMHVSLVFWSHEEGVGKNLLAECMTAIIGTVHSTLIGQAELGSAFNGWANRKILVIGDEVSRSDRRQDTDKLKGLVTGATVYFNEKYQPAREVKNLLNFIFLSNHNDALFVGDTDRRYFVWEITAGRLPDAIATEFVKWRDNGGLAGLLELLLRFNLSSFNPKAPAPMTAAKQQMVQDNRSDLETWLNDLMASDVSAVLGREVVTGHELARRYDTDTSRRNTSAKAVTTACKKLGAYARSDQVRLKAGKKYRAMAIARAEFWKEQPEAEWATELEKRLTW
ncbi:MAG: primase-helicase family protein [Sterolibacterium sp.]|jgi:hypothetical protein